MIAKNSHCCEGVSNLLGESIGRAIISSLMLFYPFEMTDEYCPPTETLAVGSAQKDLRSASLNAQKHCPPYTKDLLIAGLPQTLDAPLSICKNLLGSTKQVR